MKRRTAAWVRVWMPLLLLVGCATPETTAEPPSLSGIARQGPSATLPPTKWAIRTVSIATEIPYPAYPQVIGPAASTGSMFFGATAIAVMSQHENSDATKFKEHLGENQIDVRQIVREEFEAQLALSNAFAAIVPEGADAQFELTIDGYGLAAGFSMRPINKPLKPTLRVSAKLSSSAGKLLWENSGYITNMGSGTPSHQFDAYLADASLTREAFRKAAEIVVKEVLGSLSTAH